jgi:glycosyltransferase involved in cell wall biosynthesis
LKILMVCPQFRPLTGGYERSAERLSHALAQRGHAVHVVTERRSRAWSRQEEAGGVRISRHWCVARRRVHRISSTLGFVLFLVRAGRSFDVLHVHQYGRHSTLSLLYGRVFRVPVVLKLTNTGKEGIRAVLGGRGSWAARLHRGVDMCLALGEAMRDEAVAFGIPASRVRIVPNAVDVDQFVPVSEARRNELRVRLGVNARLLVVFSGRLEEAKNPLGLLEEWVVLAARVPDAELVFLGTGSLQGRLEEAVAQHGLTGSVRVVGRTAGVLDWYQASDVYVSASLREGMSNSLLEALACGLPVAVTAVSGATDIFARAEVGVLAPPDDLNALRKGLERLLADDALRYECAARARELALRDFSIAGVVAQVEAAYDSLRAEAA